MASSSSPFISKEWLRRVNAQYRETATVLGNFYLMKYRDGMEERNLEQKGKEAFMYARSTALLALYREPLVSSCQQALWICWDREAAGSQNKVLYKAVALRFQKRGLEESDYEVLLYCVKRVHKNKAVRHSLSAELEQLLSLLGGSTLERVQLAAHLLWQSELDEAARATALKERKQRIDRPLSHPAAPTPRRVSVTRSL